MARIEVFAPAKINLTLHVTGQRADGYHLLDSLVAFAPTGDQLTLTEADEFALEVAGPEAAGLPTDMTNLALKAAALVGEGRCATLRLEKCLPAASGIGGGSADAAAAIRGMAALILNGARTDQQIHFNHAMQLGADVPMCLDPRPVRARGIGEALDLVAVPSVAAVLVNPRVPVATPDVFQALAVKENPAMPDTLPDLPDAEALVSFLGAMRNDLEPAACQIQPVIRDVLRALQQQPGCMLVRMSGSGATCFAIFPNSEVAAQAADSLRDDRPGWWVAATMLGDCSKIALPRVQ